MTQIRSMAQPVHRRPGELGVHSLDHFNFVVPDVAQAEKFYGLFGLNTKEEDGKLALYTHGHPHRWGVVSEGPRKKFTYVSFGAYEDDLPRFRERLDALLSITGRMDGFLYRCKNDASYTMLYINDGIFTVVQVGRTAIEERRKGGSLANPPNVGVREDRQRRQ